MPKSRIVVLVAVASLVACSSSSSSSSSTTNSEQPCGSSGAHLGCACDTDGDIACADKSSESQKVVVCKSGVFVAAPLGCPTRNCQGVYPAMNSDFTGSVNCSIFSSAYDILPFTMAGAPCSAEGHGGCSLDLKSVMRCTNGKWTASMSCSGSQQCAFTSGSSIGCV